MCVMRVTTWVTKGVTTLKLTDAVNGARVTTCDNFLGVVTHVVTRHKPNKINAFEDICDNCDNFSI